LLKNTFKVNNPSLLSEKNQKYGEKTDQVRNEVLRLLIHAPNFELQWKEIRQKIFLKFADKQSLAHPYRENSINNTLTRVLDDLRLKKKLIDAKGPPKERYYFIRNNRQAEVQDFLLKKTKVNQLQSILDAVTGAELKQITDFLFELPTLYYNSPYFKCAFEEFFKKGIIIKGGMVSDFSQLTAEEKNALTIHMVTQEHDRLMEKMTEVMIILLALEKQRNKV
jgi:hypothetical protein